MSQGQYWSPGLLRDFSLPWLEAVSPLTSLPAKENSGGLDQDLGRGASGRLSQGSLLCPSDLTQAPAQKYLGKFCGVSLGPLQESGVGETG